MFALDEKVLAELETHGFDFGTNNKWAIVDSQKNFVYVTEGYASVLKMSPETLANKNLSDLWLGSYTVDGTRDRNGHRIVYRRYKGIDGQAVKLKIKNIKLTCNGKDYFAGVILDHSLIGSRADFYLAWKNHQRKLQATPIEDLTKHSLIENSVLGYTIVAMNSDIIYCNKAYAQNLGFSKDEIIFQKTSYDLTQALYTPIDTQVSTIETNHTPWLLKKYKHKAGTYVWARVKSQKFLFQGLHVSFNTSSFLQNVKHDFSSIDCHTISELLGKELHMTLTSKKISRFAEMVNMTAAEFCIILHNLYDNSVVELDGDTVESPQYKLF
jgi:PAS domain S-box-containing protein